MKTSLAFFDFMLHTADQGADCLKKLASIVPVRPFQGDYILKHFIEQDILKGQETEEEMKIYNCLMKTIKANEAAGIYDIPLDKAAEILQAHDAAEKKKRLAEEKLANVFTLILAPPVNKSKSI